MATTTDPSPGRASRRVLDHLKRHAPCTTAALAAALGVSTPAVRAQLDGLLALGLVASDQAPATGRGRPALLWTLTDQAMEVFPDRHGELTVELLDAMRAALGDDGLDAVLAARDDRQRRQLEAAMADDGDLADRLATLADRRTAQGYMAEVVADPDTDAMLLVEHHCPVCDAARECQGLCRGELELFRTVLGDDTEVTRTQHLLSGDSRCVYQIRPKRPAS